VLRSIYSILESRVKTPNGLTSLFECSIVTCQGNMLIPFVFILYLNGLIHKCNDACPGLFINESMLKVHILAYTNDVAIVNDTIGRLQC